MKWRLVDRVLGFEPWVRLRAAKALSFEEQSLLERWGRPGEAPPGLVLESCVEAARWLVAASSSFTQTTRLLGLEDFRVEALGAQRLEVAISIERRAAQEIEARAEVRDGGSGLRCAGGRLVLAPCDLAESFDREWLMGLWRELRRDVPSA
jgi:hypothetical protein